MFSNERRITVATKGGKPIEEFVPADAVGREGADGLVKVVAVTRRDGLWAELPTVYRRTVPVIRGQLLAIC
jgi:hypothetical protein